MAPRQTASKHSTITAIAALLLVGAWHTTPVLAASDHEILCDESHSATLEIAEYELTPRQAGNDPATSNMADLTSSNNEVLSEDHLLKPRVEATVREVFDDPEENSLTEPEPVDEADNAAIQELSSPHMTDGHAAPFKRQMYRRDI
jgi:hypothetical protein